MKLRILIPILTGCTLLAIARPWEYFKTNTEMKFIALLKKPDNVQISQFGPYVEPEAEQVWKLYQEQNILELYFVKEGMMPIIVLRAPSKEEAQEYLESLPMVAESLFEVELYTLQPYDALGKKIKETGEDKPFWWPVDSF